ncbi:intraflagellar transport protein 43 homolog [Plakobranchus ocellatus]|uniref:Intraflagellar transport protein 43 homolog n=1 Tax=Plakobranchus ocellatus TaxID=259542 RepID=A0AAV4DWL8_9GAST|nr:intraflagellar transport protein 43 homolog [Plakobranchus ocellatus]
MFSFPSLSDRLKQGSPDKDDSDNDIPVIPELEEQQEEDLTSKVASAPNVAINRVATYRELDNDLLKQAAFLTLDNDIDLKLLTKGLSPIEDIIEEDKPWDWDRLFTEVSSDLRTEWEKSDMEEHDEKTEAEQ